MVAPMSERFVAGHRALRRDRGHRPGDVREGATEGRRRAAVPRHVQRRGGRALRRQGPGEGQRLPHRKAARRARASYPWIIRSTAMVNHYYFYILDRDFGPLFIKFCSYFPYPAKLCLNGHEWLKRQLTQRGVPFEPLDNGIRSSDARRPRATDRRHARRRQDRRGLPQMAPPPAASLRRRPPRGRLSVSALDPASRVRPDPGPRSPASPGAVSSKRSSARISTSAGPIRCS